MPVANPPTATCVSAPGKVLLAGGYLILDRPHAGTVLALDARFHSCVDFIPLAEERLIDASHDGLVVQVHSPQFRDERNYLYRWGASPSAAALDLLPPNDGSPTPSSNKYVEVPLLYCLTLLRHQHGGDCDFLEAAVERAARTGATGLDSAAAVGLRIVLCADNGFYSQTAELRARGLPPSAASLRALPPMLPPRADGGDIAKTGLGSSATLVTSLLGALLHAFDAIVLPAAGTASDAALDSTARAGSPPKVGRSALQGADALHLLHALAQLCHCAAQGKVGSGFDVCVAVYGSQRYTRFSPAVLKQLLALPPGVPPPAHALVACLSGGDSGGGDNSSGAVWDHSVVPIQMPPGIEVIMGDVSAGANTPSMVKQVLRWRQTDAAASTLWDEYAKTSDELQRGLAQLCDEHARMRANASKLAKLRAPSAGKKVSARGAAMHPHDAEWMRVLARCGDVPPSEWPTMASVGVALHTVRTSCLALRQRLRAISHAAQTPIEPPEQTALLDATLDVRGVLMAVVPGAGGNDAILGLLLPTTPPAASGAGSTSGAANAAASGLAGDGGSTEATRAAVAALWRQWPAVAPPPAPTVVCELPVVESRASGGHNGVLLEGEEAVLALRRAREEPAQNAPEPTSPGAGGEGTPMVKKLLRVLTATELAAQQRASIRREVVGIAAVGALCAAAVFGVVRLLERRR